MQIGFSVLTRDAITAPNDGWKSGMHCTAGRMRKEKNPKKYSLETALCFPLRLLNRIETTVCLVCCVLFAQYGGSEQRKRGQIMQCLFIKEWTP
ncbi:hypothetical protein CDAR_595411 [Caerostris darwini]|uniref:Uncharacterized protein n=1 Tax=Caerostris darwini TaxID=1538125 RepID=A0AAV4SML4_9ARAC|nr:hypothetical protein CDAR_595411 [Caerostris darwini]